MPRTSEQGARSASTRREILQAAIKLYREIGLTKTTVSDIARSRSMSSANVYRFFPSKRAIEEAIVAELLEEVTRAAAAAAHGDGLPSRRLAASLMTMFDLNEDRRRHDRKLHDLLALAARENWPVFLSHANRICEVLRTIIVAGQASGEMRGDRSPAPVCLLQAMETYVMPSWINEPKLRPSFDDMLHFCAGALRQAPDELVSSLSREVASDPSCARPV